MAFKALNKINGKLKFPDRKNKFLTPTLRRMLCNALIPPHLNYACFAWYPNLNEKLKTKILKYLLKIGQKTSYFQQRV